MLCFGGPPIKVDSQGLPVPVRCLVVGRDLIDRRGVLARRLDAREGTCYLVRPDQVIAGRWRNPDATVIGAALARSLALC